MLSVFLLQIASDSYMRHDSLGGHSVLVPRLLLPLTLFLLKYMVISERQRYRYVANKGTLHLDHIYLDVMRSVIQKLWKL